MDFRDFQNNSRDEPLSRSDLDDDPLLQFERWFQDACQSDILQPNAMSLATVAPDGAPGLRTVLLKTFDQHGFVFFTNYRSKKAQHIASNPKVSLLFPWIALERQVIISGSASKVPLTESAAYFATRPRGSQLGAWVSEQSAVIESRGVLNQALAQFKQKFSSDPVPLPGFWGGYRVVPDRFEFWQGQPSRLHDRFLYSRSEGAGWKIDRLAP